MKKLLIASVTLSLLVLSVPATFASTLWGTDASDGLNQITGSRSTAPNGGLTGIDNWSNASIDWVITPEVEEGTLKVLWTYKYTITAPDPGVSSIVLEFTDDDMGINIETIKPNEVDTELGTFTSNRGNSGQAIYPQQNDIYGIKFDDPDPEWEGGTAVLEFITDRSPVLGVFSAIGGNNDNFGWLYSNALNFPFYRTNNEEAALMTEQNFIVRPNGMTVVPVPAAVWLFGSALIGLVGLRRKQQAS